MNNTNIEYFNSDFIEYFNSNFTKIYKITNSMHFIELNNFNLFKNFFRFFKFGKPYIHLFYYKKERVSRIKKSGILDVKWSAKARKYVILDELEYTNWNVLNNNIIYLNFNYLFTNNYLLSIFFNKFNSNLFLKKNKILTEVLVKKIKLWLNLILNYKEFLKISYKKKIIFLKDFSKLFWKKTLKYWFEYFILIKNSKSLFCFFKFFGIRPAFFFIFISSFLSSKFFLIFNFKKFKLKTFDGIFDEILKYLFNNCFFNFFFNFVLFLLITRWVIFNINNFIAIRKLVFASYDVFQHIESLDIYFYNLLNDTTVVDIWLKKNNLCGIKFSLFFTKILFILDWKFNIKRRPWHSFYCRFFDLLKIIKYKLLKKDRFYKILKIFYRIFFKFLYFIKKNKHNFRKKSFRLKPIRQGVKLYM